MRRTLVTVAAALLALGVVAPPASANPDSADLSLTLSWVGNGRPHVRSGQSTTYRVTVANLGPETAQQVRIGFGMYDQFTPTSASCGAGTVESSVACDFAAVAPQESVTATFVVSVCCFVVGESRNAAVYADVGSTTPDPNGDNNFQLLATWITGKAS